MQFKQFTRLLQCLILFGILNNAYATYQQNITSKIYEVQSVSEIRNFLKYIPHQGLYVVDIDDTVTNANQTFGRSKWVYGYRDHLVAQGYEPSFYALGYINGI